jgi:DNA-binding transcriptional MocR family regulator
MTKKLSAFASSLGSDGGVRPVYQRLAEAIARRSGGATPSGRAVASERELAERLAVPRTTVVSAYQQLRSAVDREPAGSGTRVRGSGRSPLAARLKEDPAGSFRRHPVYRSLVEGPGGTIEFLGAHLPAPEILHREALRIDQAALAEVSA